MRSGQGPAAQAVAAQPPARAHCPHPRQGRPRPALLMQCQKRRRQSPVQPGARPLGVDDRLLRRTSPAPPSCPTQPARPGTDNERPGQVPRDASRPSRGRRVACHQTAAQSDDSGHTDGSPATRSRRSGHRQPPAAGQLLGRRPRPGVQQPGAEPHAGHKKRRLIRVPVLGQQHDHQNDDQPGTEARPQPGTDID